MSSPSPTSPKRRPRLSLQIKAMSSSSSVRNSRTLAAAVDVKDHTTFNTLTNVYATAIDRSTPVKEKNDAWGAALGTRPPLRLLTQNSGKDTRLQSPYVGPYLDTPLSANPMSPAGGRDIIFPSAVAMTATPPLSATPADASSKVFTFEDCTTSGDATVAKTPITPRTRRRSTLPNRMLAPPYTHPRALRSILRNSPLPPLSSKSPISPRRQSLRLQEKAARRVAYNSPLCQTITTTKYTKSHIDLLSDDVSPATPSSAEASASVLDVTMAYTGDETRDGGQTPGPFEEMRRRIAGLKASSPVSPAVPSTRKKGKKREKKRRWVWTIGEEAGDEQLESPGRTAQPSQVIEAAPPTVPVLGMPSPGPKTRARTAAAAAAMSDDATNVPVIALPVPKRARSTAASVPTIALQPPPTIEVQPATELFFVSSAPRPSPKRRATLEVPIIERPLSPIPQVAEDPTTPTETNAMVEPPTPSVDSIMSQDSVFTAPPDVEMSDAGSALSVDDIPTIELKEATDDEMDTGTPTQKQNASALA